MHDSTFTMLSEMPCLAGFVAAFEGRYCWLKMQ
jgi:hypothetical protein